MFCEKCGGELRREKKMFICDKCGISYDADYSEGCDAEKPEKIVISSFSSKKNIIVIALAGMLALGIGGAAVAIGASNSAEQSAPSGIQLAERYLSEMNYEQAVIEFQKILEIEPMNVDAYLGLAEAYIGLGDEEKAIEWLQKGYDLTGDEGIKAKIEEIHGENTSTPAESSIEPVESSIEPVESSSEPVVEVDLRAEQYASAVKSMEENDFESAIELFQSIAGYLDSDELLIECKYLYACQNMQNGLYQDAISRFSELGDYKDSKANIEQCNSHIRYNSAVSLMDSGNYSQAMKEFEALGAFLDSNNKATECKYQYAIQLMNDGKYTDAKVIFAVLGNYKQSKTMLAKCEDALYDFTVNKVNPRTISVGGYDGVLGVRTDGTVAYDAIGYVERDYEMESISTWKNIVGVASGWNVEYGLTSGGKVVGTGPNYRDKTANWENVVKIAPGQFNLIALHSNGTVSTTSIDDVSDWKYIVDVAAGNVHSLGLKSDGTVVATGSNEHGQCNVSEWRDIIAIDAGSESSVGLRADGTVVYAGDNTYGQGNVSSWSNIVAVATDSYYTIGLKSNGTVVFAGRNNDEIYLELVLSPSIWNNIVAIDVFGTTIIGLKSEGTLIAHNAVVSELLGDGNSVVFTGIKQPN